MFETNESARLEIHSALATPGEYVWDYAYMRLNTHWFHVVTRGTIEDEGHREHKIFFLNQISQLLALKRSSAWEITELSLVSPAWLNSSDHWKMELVEEILVGREATLDHEQYGHVFVLKNGSRYVYSFTHREADLTDMEPVHHAEGSIRTM